VLSNKKKSFFISLKHSNIDHDSIYTLSWNLGNRCNYKCSYCPDLLHKGDIIFPDKVLIISTIKHILGKIPKNKKLYVEFTGGEVTLHPDLIEITQALKYLDASIGIISNGSKKSTYWEKLALSVDHICLSYHSEFASKKHFQSIVELLSKMTTLHVNIMADKNKVRESIDYLRDIAREVPGISLELQPIVLHDLESSRDLINYEQNELDLFRNFVPPTVKPTSKRFSTRGNMKALNSKGLEVELSAAQLVSTNRNDFSGYSCHAGLESLVIDYRGYIYRAKCNIGGPIGHITSRPLNIPQSEVICDKLRCTCNFDITITKKLNKEVM
jgi:MoaA/NifB/PqqE/SkfB family radical SAM enzyme